MCTIKLLLPRTWDGLNKYMAGVNILDILLKLSYLLFIEKMKTGL